MGVKLNKNCCWVQLVDQDELILLIMAMKWERFDGVITSVEWKDLRGLGKRMKVTVQQPGTTPSNKVSYLRFEDYKAWKRIKREIYKYRKTRGSSSNGSKERCRTSGDDLLEERKL